MHKALSKQLLSAPAISETLRLVEEVFEKMKWFKFRKEFVQFPFKPKAKEFGRCIQYRASAQSRRWKMKTEKQNDWNHKHSSLIGIHGRQATDRSIDSLRKRNHAEPRLLHRESFGRRLESRLLTKALADSSKHCHRWSLLKQRDLAKVNGLGESRMSNLLQ